MCGTTDVLADPVRQACSKKNFFRVFGDHLAIGIPIPIHHFVSLMFKQPIQTTSVQNELRIFFGSANLSLQSCPHWVQAPGKGGAQKFTLTTGVWFFFSVSGFGVTDIDGPMELATYEHPTSWTTEPPRHEKPTFAQRQWTKAKLQGDSRHAEKPGASICSPFSHGAFHSPKKNYGE